MLTSIECQKDLVVCTKGRSMTHIIIHPSEIMRHNPNLVMTVIMIQQQQKQPFDLMIIKQWKVFKKSRFLNMKHPLYHVKQNSSIETLTKIKSSRQNINTQNAGANINAKIKQKTKPKSMTLYSKSFVPALDVETTAYDYKTDLKDRRNSKQKMNKAKIKHGHRSRKTFDINPRSNKNKSKNKQHKDSSDVVITIG